MHKLSRYHAEREWEASFLSVSLSYIQYTNKRTHMCTHSRSHTHTHTHARTHTHTHTHTIQTPICMWRRQACVWTVWQVKLTTAVHSLRIAVFHHRPKRRRGTALRGVAALREAWNDLLIWQSQATCSGPRCLSYSQIETHVWPGPSLNTSS